MCLTSKKKTVSISNNPITCYKIIRHDKRALYQDYKYPDNLENTILEENSKESYLELDNSIKIYGGYFHAFTELNLAIEITEVLIKWDNLSGIHYANCSSNNQDAYEIWECEIPENTEYFVGIEKDICAKKLKFIKQINKYI